MCLNSVTKIYDKPDRKKVIGYKVVRPLVDLDFGTWCELAYVAPIYNNCMFSKYSQNVDSGIGIITRPPFANTLGEDFSDYPTGFHVFTQFDDAVEWMSSSQQVWKVECTDIVAEGLQDGVEVVVCKKFSFLEVKYVN